MGPSGAIDYESYHETYVDTGILTHDRWALETVQRQVVSFGEYYGANLFYPKERTAAQNSSGLPVVIWLHPYNPGLGIGPVPTV